MNKRIVTRPPGARVTVDGERLGTTPLEVTVPAGDSVTVELRRRGYRPAVEDVSADSPDEVRVRLEQRPGRAAPPLAPR